MITEEMMASGYAAFAVHAGFVLTALAFLVREILWLRLVAALSYGIFAGAALAQGRMELDFLPWYLAFAAINAGHAAYLLYERRLARMTAEERDLHALAFPAVERVLARRLMRCGAWLTLASASVLTRQGERPERLYLIAGGCVRIEVGGVPVRDLGPGDFVGEMSFVADRPASATACAASGDGGAAPVRCLAWRVADLRRRMDRDAVLRSTLFAAIGADLAAKVAGQTLSVAGPAAPQMRQP